MTRLAFKIQQQSRSTLKEENTTDISRALFIRNTIPIFVPCVLVGAVLASFWHEHVTMRWWDAASRSEPIVYFGYHYGLVFQLAASVVFGYICSAFFRVHRVIAGVIIGFSFFGGILVYSLFFC